MKIITCISLSANLILFTGSIFCMQDDTAYPIFSMSNYTQEALSLDHFTPAAREFVESLYLDSSNLTANKPADPALELLNTLMLQEAPAPNPTIREAASILKKRTTKIISLEQEVETLKQTLDQKILALKQALDQDVQTLNQALHNEHQKNQQIKSKVPSANNERVLVPVKTSRKKPWDASVTKFTLKKPKPLKKAKSSRAASPS